MRKGERIESNANQFLFFQRNFTQWPWTRISCSISLILHNLIVEKNWYVVVLVVVVAIILVVIFFYTLLSTESRVASTCKIRGHAWGNQAFLGIVRKNSRVDEWKRRHSFAVLALNHWGHEYYIHNPNKLYVMLTIHF